MVAEAGVDFVEAFEDGFDGVLGTVHHLDGLVTPDGEFRALEGTEGKDVPGGVDQLGNIGLYHKKFSFRLIFHFLLFFHF